MKAAIAITTTAVALIGYGCALFLALAFVSDTVCKALIWVLLIGA